MAKRTLLDMTQKILSSMDSDEVDSITDTSEATQVAEIIENTFYDLVAESVIPEHRQLINLQGSATTARPTHMTLPDGVDSVIWVMYNIETTADSDLDYRPVEYKDPFEFLDFINGRSEAETNVTKVVDTVGNFLIRTDKMPEFFTTFDDQTLIFDSYDSAEESTLTGSRTLCLGRSLPTFSLSDTFIPDIDDHLFPLLYNEAKSQCFEDLKQTVNRKAEQRARKLRTLNHRSRNRVDFSNSPARPDYGRKVR